MRLIKQKLELPLLIVFLLCSTGSAIAQQSTKCVAVKGRLVNQEQFTGSPCAAPANLFCIRGEATGDLQGKFVSTANTLTLSADAKDTAVVFLTATLSLQTRSGDLTIKEAIAYNSTKGGGEFGDLGTVTAGTEGYSGATGRLRIWGRLNFEDPSDVNYEGQVCTP